MFSNPFCLCYPTKLYFEKENTMSDIASIDINITTSFSQCVTESVSCLQMVNYCFESYLPKMFGVGLRDIFYLFSDTRLLILMGCRSADWRPSSISLSPFRSPIETMLHLLSFVNVENCPSLNQSVIYRWHLKNWSPKPSKSCADASLRQYIERKHEYVTNWNEK